ncbi:MAG: type II toxin-antitoxin system RelE/ParE family toxin [Acidiferrobacterales bacterium]
MKIYKTKWFHRWAAKEGLNAAVLRAAIVEMEQGLADALGGYLYKKRIAIPGRGKRGGARTLVAFRRGSSAFFIYGYPQNERANVTDRELGALRLLAKELLGYSEQQLATAIQAGELFEMNDDGKA